MVSFRNLKWAGLIVLTHAATYYGVRYLSGGRTHYCMELAIERRIPFIPWTVGIYWGAFLFWAVSCCYLLLAGDEKSARRFAVMEIIGTTFCAVIFLILPTTMERPAAEGRGVWMALVRLLYRVDEPNNLFPSIHCYLSWLCYLCLKEKKEIPAWLKKLTGIVAVLICISTLTVKQHVVVDVAAGILAAYVIHKFCPE